MSEGLVGGEGIALMTCIIKKPMSIVHVAQHVISHWLECHKPICQRGARISVWTGRDGEPLTVLASTSMTDS
jgi:hypothetical protein